MSQILPKYLLTILIVLIVGIVQAQSLKDYKDSLATNPNYTEKGISSLLEQDQPDSILLEAWYILGYSQESQNKQSMALQAYQKAYDIAINKKDTARFFNIRIRMANCQFHQGNYSECFELYLANYEFAAPLNDCVYKPTATINLAGIYYYLQRKDKCLEFQRRAVQAALTCGDTNILQRSSRNIATLYTEAGKNDSAQYWMKRGIDLVPKTSYSELSNAYAIYGMSFPYPEQKEKRMYYYRKAVEQAVLGNDSLSMAFAYLKYSSHFILEEQLDSAELYTKRALKIYRDNKLVDGIQHAMGYLPEVYSKLGDKDKEIKSLRDLSKVRDTILNEITAIKTAELETLYETEKKKKENLKLKAQNAENESKILKEKESKNKILFVSVITFLILVLAGIILFFKTRLKRKEELRQLEKEKTNAIINAEEKERVRIARELHDGIGQQLSGLKLNFSQLSKDLEIHSSEIANTQISKMENILDDACKDVRTISHQMMPRALQDMGLLAALENMLKNSLSGSNIDYSIEHFKATGRFQRNIEVSFYRIGQELINNIIKHSKATKIHVQLSEVNNSLIMIVEDNGHGFEVSPNNTGIGLLNIKTRIDTINGKINFDSTAQSGTTATVRVSLS